MTPLVSVCIPAYGAERFIALALESVLTQSFADFEVIVVDDASPDRTAEIASAFGDERVQVHRNPQNLGAAANWDAVVARAQGAYIKLLCSDDTLYPTCLAREVEVLERYPDVVLVSAQRDIIDDRGVVIAPRRGIRQLEGRIEGRDAIQRIVRSGANLVGEPSAALARADALRACGPFNPDAAYVLDLDMWFRLLQRGDFFGIAEPLCTFRVSSSSWSAHLVSQQASQVRRFFRAAHERNLVTRRDAVVGQTRATALAYARRIAFRRVRRRVLSSPQ